MVDDGSDRDERSSASPTGEHGEDDKQRVWDFFAWSDGLLDYHVLRPLSHVTLNWEARWDHASGRYASEADSFADDLNAVIDLIAACDPPARYHDHEDVLAERTLRDLGWPI